MTATLMARIVVRVSEVRKVLFERAVFTGGYHSVTRFVFKSAQERAREIVDAYETALQSERGRQVLIDALMNPPKHSEKTRAGGGAL